MLLVALGAAYASYRHGQRFALRFGADLTTAAIWPLIVDGLLTTATVELWKPARGEGRWRAWLGFLFGVPLSLCANIASAPELSAFAIAVAACPPLALLLAVELLNRALKRHRTNTSHTRETITRLDGPETDRATEKPFTETPDRTDETATETNTPASLAPISAGSGRRDLTAEQRNVGLPQGSARREPERHPARNSIDSPGPTTTVAECCAVGSLTGA